MYKKTVLNNGMKLIVSPMKNTRIVTVNVFVGCGSRHENKSNNGITHFIEHMLFKGTKKRKDAFSISKEVDGVGGDLNGLTGQEYCCFYIRVLDNHFEKALDLLSDILLNSKFNESDMDTERGAILEEIKMRKDSPAGYVWELYNDLLYGGQPLGFPISGSEKVLKGFSKSNLLDYMGDNFTADNIVISLAGNVGMEKTIKMAQKYFGGLKGKKTGGFVPVKEKQKEPAVLLFYKETEQTHLCIGNRTFRYDHPDYNVMQIINGILGMNMSSRLFTRLREKEGLVYSVSSGNDFFADTGNFSVHAGVGHSNVMRTIGIVLEEFSRLRNEQTRRDELDRVKNCITGYIYMLMDGSTGVSNYTGRQEIRMGKIVPYDERIRMINEVSPQDVKRVANEIFTGDSRNLAMIGPFRDSKEFIELLEKKG